MKLAFSKMQGAGNDFVMANGSAAAWPRDPQFIANICDRRLGVGADGLIIVSRDSSGLRMEYYNSDGSKAALCGNGLRCAAVFARESGLSDADSMELSTDSGKLPAKIVGDGSVRIRMPVSEPFREYSLSPELKAYKGSVGVPHAVVPVHSAAMVDVKTQGRLLRFHQAFMPDGANVDFIEAPPSWKGPVRIRTYERGVEDETLACGTGAVASAVCARLFLGAPDELDMLCAGGDVLHVELTCKDNIVQDAHLTGPAKTSFTGILETGSFGQSRRQRN